jgi:hypothetical protein
MHTSLSQQTDTTTTAITNSEKSLEDTTIIMELGRDTVVHSLAQ